MALNLLSAVQQKTPTSSGAYTTNVNTALKNKGVAADQIGYNPSTNAYTVGGQPFMTATKNYGGAGYTSPQNFTTAWNAYSSKQPAHTTTQSSTAYNPYASSTSNSNPYNQQVNSTIASLMNIAQNPKAIDPYSTAEYAAAQAQAQKAAGENVRAAQEAYGSAGFGRSYGLGERVSGIQNDATNYLMTQVVPSIIAAKQAEQQNQFNNSLSALNQLINQQSRADQQVQQDFTNNYNVAQLTGTYMPAGAQQVINQLIGLKQQAETKGITADQRAGLSSQADTLRSQLASMGIDPSLYGANVNAATAGQNMNTAGTRTLAGQAQDLANRESNINTALQYGDRAGLILSPQQDPTGYLRQIANGVTSAGTPVGQTLEASNADRNYNYQVGRDKVADAQWQAEFNQRAEQYGIQNALNWAQQTLNENEFADNSAYKWAGLDADLAAAANQGYKYEGMTANQIIDNVRKNLGDGDGKIPAEQTDAAYLQIVNSGLPEDQENQVLAAIGLTKSQIDALDKKYLSPK